MDPLANNTNPQWWKDSGMRRLNFLLLACYIGAMANGYISSLISNLIANPRYFQDIQGLSHPKLLGLVTAAQSMGCIAAFFPAPWLSDKYGRRVGIIFGNIGMIAGFTGQIFCTRFDQFLGMRILVGFSSISNTISSSALLVELAHPRQRAVAGALFNTCYFIGSITAAWVSYGALRIRGSWSWKLPVAIQLFWSLAQLSLIIFCPESPRWLVRHGKQEKARSIMIRYHANGHDGDELVSSEFARMCASTAAEAHNNTTGWLALLSTPGNRKRLVLSVVIAVATQWVGNGIIRCVQMHVQKDNLLIISQLLPGTGTTNSRNHQLSPPTRHQWWASDIRLVLSLRCRTPMREGWSTPPFSDIHWPDASLHGADNDLFGFILSHRLHFCWLCSDRIPLSFLRRLRYWSDAHTDPLRQ
jgi:MFS family permease